MSRNAARESIRAQIAVLLPITLIVGIGFLAAYQFVKPAPPKTLVMSAGRQGGAYFSYAARYREVLEREGITLKILDSAGSSENLERLISKAQGVQAAFIQGGVGAAAQSDNLVGLGSLYFEPLWLFSRKDDAIRRISDLNGKRVAIGEPGSGTRLLAQQILADNDLDETDLNALPLAGRAAAESLLNAETDAVFLVASPGAAAVQTLLWNDDVIPMSFDRAEAYRQRHRFLSSVTLAEGIIDLRRNIPARPIVLLAPAATLIVRDDLHPALIDLLLQAAQEVHSTGGMFEQPGQFPSARHVDFPLSREAARFYKYGPPFLQRYLPFWAATLVDRLKVMLLPLLVLMIPLLRFAPHLYRWRVRSRIYRWYEQVNDVEDDIDSTDSVRTMRLLKRLDHIEDEATQVRIPLSYMDQMYHLRTHIEYVRARLRE